MSDWQYTDDTKTVVSRTTADGRTESRSVKDSDVKVFLKDNVPADAPPPPPPDPDPVDPVQQLSVLLVQKNILQASDITNALKDTPIAADVSAQIAAIPQQVKQEDTQPVQQQAQPAQVINP